ncbi:hypothetical protein PAMC26577_35920 [Caballeronia sordidicola]|uniref:Uncharacterized protein n=1 Tax=Caballeronia sordidicola TaxID=196367 RepID=A0A242MAP8_CABSO|nr:hypothetical protein PAMC26577_35920 [Caballeronia sordidicola]
MLIRAAQVANLRTGSMISECYSLENGITIFKVLADEGVSGKALG